jgi:hypothetical protein
MNIISNRNDCIWSIRAISEKLIAVDFITKSFVVVIRLNEMEKSCTKDIQQLEIISRLCGNIEKLK